MANRTKRSGRQLFAGIFLLLAVAAAALLAGSGFLDGLYARANLRNDSEATSKPVSVHFIDVGQGECSLIQTEFGNILIDAGERPYGPKVVAYLRGRGVQKLDYVIATHPHSDHIGGLPEVLESFEVTNIILPRLTEENMQTTQTYELLLKAIRDSGVKAIAAVPDGVYTLGEVTLHILGPISQTTNMNNMSVISRVTYQKTAFLFTGDAETPVEKELLANGGDLAAAVLSAGHHGSKTSSTEDFLAAVQPKLAIISCGRGNSYGHPDKAALDRLAAIGAQVLRTDICGTIVVGSDGETLYLHYENQE